MPGPLAALAPYIITAAATVGSQLLSNRANRRMSKFAYKKDREMWERQNEYNSPEQQQQRIKGAGLNPALMYGQGTVGNATQLPQYNVPQQSYQFTDQMNPLEMLGTYQDLKQKSANVSLTEEQVQTEGLRQVLTQAQSDNTISITDINKIEANYRSAILEAKTTQEKEKALYEGFKAVVEKHRAELAKRNQNPNDSTLLRLIGDIAQNWLSPEMLQKLFSGFGKLPKIGTMNKPILR